MNSPLVAIAVLVFLAATPPEQLLGKGCNLLVCPPPNPIQAPIEP